MKPRRIERLLMRKKILSQQDIIDLYLKRVASLLDIGLNSYKKLKQNVIDVKNNLDLSIAPTIIDSILSSMNSLEEFDNEIEVKFKEIRGLFNDISPSIEELREFEHLFSKTTLKHTIRKEIIDLLLDIRIKLNKKEM